MFYYLLDLSCGECNVKSLYVLCFSVNGSLCFVCCMSDSVCELFGETICVGVVIILLLNVMELFSVVGGALLHRPYLILYGFPKSACGVPVIPHNTELQMVKVGLVGVFVF